MSDPENPLCDPSNYLDVGVYNLLEIATLV